MVVYIIFKIAHSFFYLSSKFLIDEVYKATKVKYDIIFAHDIITSYAAYKIGKNHKAKIIYDVHDLYLFDAGAGGGHPRQRYRLGIRDDRRPYLRPCSVVELFAPCPPVFRNCL